MALEIVKAKMYQRRDTTANWLKYNPVLASGEFGYDTNEKKYKIGDGTSHWNDLEFAYMGIITNENSNILKYKKIATEEYVNEHITEDVIFSKSKDSFPSIGEEDKLYVDLDNNLIYTWNSTNLIYKAIGADVTLPDEKLKPLIENAVDAVLVDKLNEDVPAIVKSTLEDNVLCGGDSSYNKDNTI